MNEEEKLLKIISLIQDDKISIDDFVKITNILVEVVKEVQNQNEADIEERKKQVSEALSGLFSEKEQIEKLKELVENKIASVKDGVTPVKGKDYFDGEPGKPGKDADVLEAVALVLEEIGSLPTKEEVAEQITANPEAIRDSLELLEGEERLDAKYIKGLEKLIKKLAGTGSSAYVGGGGGGFSRSHIKDIDISSQFNGVLSVFSIEAVYTILTVSLSSFPYGSLRKGVDYTFNVNGTITFLDTIDPATQLSTGQRCILTVISA